MSIPNISNDFELNSFPKESLENEVDPLSVLEKIRKLGKAFKDLKGSLSERKVVDLSQLAKEVIPSIVRVEVNGTLNTLYQLGEGDLSSHGTGLVASSDGFILTNHHVIDGAKKIDIFINGKEESIGATIWGSDPGTDIALLKVEADGLKPLSMAKKDINIGDPLISIGNPFGFQNLLTLGVVGGRGSSLEGACGQGFNLQSFGFYSSYILSDTTTNPGNSGGPVFNTKGEVVGMHARGGEGIGIHIDNLTLERVLTQLRDNGYVSRNFLGARLIFLDEKDFFLLDVEENVKKGIMVTDIMEGSPAEQGGLQFGDLVIGYNGKVPQSLSQFLSDIANQNDLSLDVLRNGEVLQLSFPLSTYKVNMQTRIDPLGISVEELDGEKPIIFGFDPNVHGVLISSAVSYSSLLPGWVITGVRKTLGDPVQGVNSVQDLLKIIEESGELTKLILSVVSPFKNQQIYVSVIV